MSINRVAAQRLISEIPVNLRNAARAERKVIINETKKDPVGTSIRAAYGQFDFTNNIKLQQKMAKLKNKIALETYDNKHSAEPFIQRQPTGPVEQLTKKNKVVHASMML